MDLGRGGLNRPQTQPSSLSRTRILEARRPLTARVSNDWESRLRHSCAFKPPYRAAPSPAPPFVAPPAPFAPLTADFLLELAAPRGARFMAVPVSFLETVDEQKLGVICLVTGLLCVVLALAHHRVSLVVDDPAADVVAEAAAEAASVAAQKRRD